MGSLAVLGITNDGANLVVSLLILFLLVFWLALIYWTYADARRRIEDPMLVGCATAAAFFPFVGTIVYMIVRPPEYLDDRRERELEIAAAEARLASIEHLNCPYCAFEIERSFLRCPSCLRRLKEPCTTCGKPLDPRWKICPYCEAEIGQPQPQPAPRRRHRERPTAAPAAEPPPRQRKPARQAPAPASGNGEPVRQPPAPARRKAAPAPRAEAPAAEEPRKRPRPQRAADGNRVPRPGDPAQRQRPNAARKKRPAAGSTDHPVSDEVTAEQPATRPRTRPPSAG